MSTTLELPIIDLSKAYTDRKECAKKVVHGLENVGFLFIDNVSNLDNDGLFKACKWFFDKPMEFKRTVMRNFWNPENKNIYRGYFPVVEGEPSRKEGFEFARDIRENDPTVADNNWFYEKSPWPAEDGTFPFKTFLQEHYEILHNTALEILRLAAIGLGIEENAFDDIFADRPCSTFRIMHYPPWVSDPPQSAYTEDGKLLITPAHTDTNFLTLLTRFNYSGLEIQTQTNEWVEVDPRPGSLVMNIGDTFSRMMGGRFKATCHRVIDIKADRYAVPFFFTPSYDGDIGINFMSKATGQGPDHKRERYGPWVLDVIKNQKKYFEYRVLPDIEPKEQ
jgi:isopenicillin N synthase-like dioxygenase